MRKIDIDKQKLEKCCYEEDLSISEIADIFDCSYGVIYDRMERWDIPSKKQRKDSLIDKDRIEELYVDENLTITEISETHEFQNLSRKKIWTILDKRDVTRSTAENVQGEDNPFYGKTHGREVRQKVSEAVKQAWENGDSYQHAYEKPSKEARRKMSESAKKRCERKPGPEPNYNEDACLVIKKFGAEHGYNFQHAENGGEYWVENCGYWLDGYDNEENVAIEYYEKSHKHKREQDRKRKREIKAELGCGFVEVFEEGFIKYNW